MTSGRSRERAAPSVILATWGVGAARVTSLSGGLESAVWRVATSAGDALLRWSRIGDGGFEAIIAEMDWLHRLRAGGVHRTPSPLRPPLLDDGGEGAWSLLSWVVGEPSNATLTSPKAEALGRLLAQVHLCPGRPQQGTPRRYDAVHFGGCLDVLETILPELREDERGQHALRTQVGEALRHLEVLTDRELGDVHADAHPGNVVWDGTTPGLIDFGRCGTGPAVLDVAMAMHYLDERPADALLNGYRAVKEVDRQQHAALPHLRLLAAVDNLATLTRVDDEVNWVRQQVPWLLRLAGTCAQARH